jgi:hypothetical protein
MEEVEKADREQLCRWYRFLPSPGWWPIRIDVLKRIIERHKEMGGFTPEISKKIGWGRKET